MTSYLISALITRFNNIYDLEHCSMVTLMQRMQWSDSARKYRLWRKGDEATGKHSHHMVGVPPPCAARQSKSDLIFTPKFLRSEVRRPPRSWLTRPTTTSITTQQTINKWTQRYREILYKRSNLTPESSDIRSESPFSHHSLRLLQPHFES